MAARFVDVLESGIDQFKENAVPQKTKQAANHQCNSTKTSNTSGQQTERARVKVVVSTAHE